MGDVVYKLQLLAGARLHNVFYVILLKKLSDEQPKTLVPLPPVHHGRACLKPANIFKSHLFRGHHELLVTGRDGMLLMQHGWSSMNSRSSFQPSMS
jgi:hypothetical protein